MLNELIGGQIQVSVAAAISAIPHVRSGRLRALAIGDARRSTELPDLPTIAESGVPGYQATIWTGMFAPARTPTPVIARINAEAVRAVQSADFRAKLIELGAEPAGGTPAQWGAFVREEIDKWARIAKSAKIVAD
jgi:tripartite-type tricarboxylate transporter receptor subunit TctC